MWTVKKDNSETQWPYTIHNIETTAEYSTGKGVVFFHDIESAQKEADWLNAYDNNRLQVGEADLRG